MKGKTFWPEYKMFPIWELLKQFEQISKVQPLLGWMTVISGWWEWRGESSGYKPWWKWLKDLGSEAVSHPTLVLSTT